MIRSLNVGIRVAVAVLFLLFGVSQMHAQAPAAPPATPPAGQDPSRLPRKLQRKQPKRQRHPRIRLQRCPHRPFLRK